MISAALVCLAMNVYHEARGEPVIGQYAVAQVVMNRVHSDRFPDDICKVIHQGFHKGRHKCQFSWYCDGKSDKAYDELAWARSLIVADNVFSGRVLDVTSGSTHYHALSVKPYWSKEFKITATYGSHRFYE